MEAEAAVLFQKNDLRIERLSFPELSQGQVLVQVAYSGVCHSQLLEVEGKRGIDPYLPHTLGHEASGRVLDIGPNVTKVREGDHVVLTWIQGEGENVPGPSYDAHGVKVNSGPISTFMNRTITSENRLVRIPKEMPLREAALLGCMIPTGAGIVFHSAQVKPGNSLVVFGVGGIGLSVVLAAKLAGANPVIAVDIIENKLSMARKVGATHVIHGKDGGVLDQIQAIVKGDGVDFAIESAGRALTMETAFQSVRPKGGLCILAGNLPKGDKIKIDPFDLIKGKQIMGSWGGETDPDRDIPRYVEKYFQGELNLDGLITKEYALQEIQTALDDLRAGRLGRGLVRLESASRGL